MLLNVSKLQSSRLKTFFAEDSEREAALALRRPLVEEHWAWFEEILFAVRSLIMATAQYNLTAAGLWEYPLIAFRSLALSGRDKPHDFFSIFTCSGSMETKQKNGQLQLRNWLAHGTQT
jgi:hypothetical protein